MPPLRRLQALFAVADIPQAPLPPLQQRSANMDALRGLAVLGIFFMNIFSMGISCYDYVPLMAGLWQDTLGEALYYLVLRDRFITLFAMLFGAGLYLQWCNFSARGQPATQLVRRRLSWLALFGLLHGILLWPGDILFNYALCGMLVWRYRTLAPATLLLRGCQFFSIGILMTLLVSQLPSDSQPLYRSSSEYLQQYQLWTGEYSIQVWQQLLFWLMDLLIFPLTYLWLLCGLMLLGMHAISVGWFSQGVPPRLAAKMWVAALLLALLAGYVALFRHVQWLAEVLVQLAAVPMAYGFMQLICRYCGDSAKRLASLQAVGRIPLTLYILQSLLGVLLFRHLAPALLLTLNRLDYLLLASIWSLLQLLLAVAYLRYWRQGPLEWCWRYLAFGQPRQGALLS